MTCDSTQTHTHTHTHTHVHSHTQSLTYSRYMNNTRIHTHVHIRTRIHTHMHIRVYVQTCIYTHTHAHTHKRTHTYTHRYPQHRDDCTASSAEGTCSSRKLCARSDVKAHCIATRHALPGGIPRSRRRCACPATWLACSVAPWRCSGACNDRAHPRVSAGHEQEK